MKSRKKTTNGQKSIIILLALAVILLVGSALGSTSAALSYYSDNYTANLAVSEIGVALVENGNETSEKLLANMVGENEKIQLGKKYPEELTVRNTGEIDQYVRVSIVKSWMKDGKKVTSLSPDLIDLNLTGNGWIEDKNASTEERTVLYYSGILAGGAEAPIFADTIRIDGSVATQATKETVKSENGYTTITTTYKYDGVTFNLEAQVDAVQTHNAQDAIKSAWGVDVKVSPDGTLSL
ncbi:hypothetical protein DWX43_22295 [Clostridium sp. AF19-22AC]|jgi:hypothetical protein|uniref:Alternate signal-mediated exported protein, CPF_0494 family n=1 Tax=Faecalicatena orotica TaxID=1544 RepID=A0A2Y9BIY8_9FIRM|nr:MULTISPECIES: hypothetical protein [Clostridia]PWJ22859.1 hypothetical protein A8806_11634 [Faecalicatena orotica]RHR22238.1 hypothetical protein DWX43_22295 [Clostridium sp. AF19-22AC]SSA57994.1 hypothetical protein SAMN05216536_11634 [Faecalicatena orotica]